MPKRKIQYLPVDELESADHNAKNHASDLIAASIARFGFVESIVRDDRTGKIISGHGRRDSLIAAHAAGEEPPDGVVLGPGGRWLAPVETGWSSKDDAEAVAAGIALNRVGEEGGWDFEALAVDLEFLDGLGGGGFEGVGFDDDDLDEILASLEEQRLDEGARASDDVPAVPSSPVTKRGDLWRLGDHLLLCGDATNVDDLKRVMGNARADLVFTDPPYGVGYTGGAKERAPLEGDELGTTIYADTLPHLRVVAADHAALYLWYADAHAAAAAAAAAAAGYVVTAQIVWVKNNAQFMTAAHYKGKHEICFYAHRKGKTARWCGPNNEVTVWEIDRAHKNEYHPTQKPVALCARAIRNSSAAGDLVLDPFGGSGATLMACEQEGRHARLVEIDPGYCDVICARWAAHTGLEAALVAD